MRREQRSLAELLTRSLVVSGVVYAAVILYAVPASLLASDNGRPAPLDGSGGSLSQATSQPSWKRVHAQRYPDCVDMAAWDAPAAPSSVVVVLRDGDLARMSFDEAFDRATSHSAADDVWTIGACG